MILTPVMEAVRIVKTYLPGQNRRSEVSKYLIVYEMCSTTISLLLSTQPSGVETVEPKHIMM